MKQQEDQEGVRDCLSSSLCLLLIHSVLKRNSLHHVVVVEGGFYAIHEYLYQTDRFDWLVDHDEKTCPVCEYYQLKHVMNKVKDSVSQTAQSVATKAVSALQKMQETIAKQDPNELKDSLNDVKQSLSTIGNKGKSLFSKALSWTKEKSLSLAEDVNKRSKLEGLG